MGGQAGQLRVCAPRSGQGERHTHTLRPPTQICTHTPTAPEGARSACTPPRSQTAPRGLAHAPGPPAALQGPCSHTALWEPCPGSRCRVTRGQGFERPSRPTGQARAAGPSYKAGMRACGVGEDVVTGRHLPGPQGELAIRRTRRDGSGSPQAPAASQVPGPQRARRAREGPRGRGRGRP